MSAAVALPASLPELKPAEQTADVAFLLDMGKALHRYGVPAHRLEEMLTLLAGRLGLTAQFVSTPTAIFASFGPPEALRTGVIRAEPGDFDIGRLSELDALADQVIRGQCSVPEGVRRLHAILAAPVRYRTPLLLVAHVVSAAAGARLFGGHIREIVVAGLIGLIVGPLSVLSRNSPARARVLETTAAMLATLLAAACARLAGPLSVEVATLAGLIVLLPGLSLTTALTEIATRNLISGAARLTGVSLVFLQLAFGVALGAKIAGLASIPIDAAIEQPFPPWTMGVAIVAISLGFVVLFEARLRDTLWVLLAATVSYWGAKFGTRLLGPELGAFGGSLLIGVVGNVMTARLHRPAVIVNVPGLILLVPGSLGFRSVQSLLARDILTGIETAFSMVLVGVAIVAGQLIANTIYPPKKAL